MKVCVLISRRKKLEYNDECLPLVSFIIPTLNSEKTLQKCLQSIVDQEYPSIEIIIIDGGSLDNTLSIAKKYPARIFKFSGSLGATRQLGINNSSGEIIANWDSDVYIPHKKWLYNAVKTLLQYEYASTLWVYNIPPPNSTLVEKAFAWYGWNMMLDLAKRSIGFWGGGVSLFKRRMVQEVGGFDVKVDIGEDFDLARKLSLKGYKVIFYTDYVYHDTFRSFSELIRKDIRRARNFKNKNMTWLTGIPLGELVGTNLKVGFILSLKNLFTKKKAYYGLVPIIVLLRLIVYTIMHLLP